MAYDDDEELRELLEKRKAEIANQLKQQQTQAQKEAEIKAKLEREYILRSILTDDARERLERIKLARPQFAKFLEDQLILLAKTGRIVGRITDEQLKRMLLELTKKEGKKEGNIRIMRKGLE